MFFKLTMILRRESPENAYTVTCEELPELITEGDTIDEALDNSVDAFVTTLGIYEELNKELPSEIMVTEPLANTPVSRQSPRGKANLIIGLKRLFRNPKDLQMILDG